MKRLCKIKHKWTKWDYSDSKIRRKECKRCSKIVIEARPQYEVRLNSITFIEDKNITFPHIK